MYSVWSFFINKKNFSFLVLGALFAAGIFSLISIQKESNPEVELPIGIVSTALPGASAEDVETLLTDKIETAIIGSISGINRVTSVSQQGLSTITVEFNAEADFDTSIQDLKDRVDSAQAELPSDATDPQVLQIDFSQQPVLTFAVAGDVAPSEFAHIGRELESDLETISGVSDVIISGAPEREVQVIVNAESLRAYNISLDDVVNAIRQANVTSPAGSIVTDSIQYNLQFNASIDDPAEVGEIIINSTDGRLLYVRDVALVSDGLAEAVSLSRVSIDGNPSQPSLSFNVQKQAGSDLTAVTNAVNKRLLELTESGELLHGMDVLTIFDTGEYLQRDLTTLTSSGIMAILLVMLVLFVTIGWRESLVAGLSIPISFMIAFFGLMISGNTLNFISLFALILSVGILVDSAIVIVEGIHTNMRAWMDKKEAALKTIRDFHAPVTAGTMTTVAVFVPLFFISGIVGEFIQSIPFTIISVLIASLVVALGFIPLIASLVLRRRMTSTLEERQEQYTERVLTWYKARLAPLLDNIQHQNIFLAGIIGLFFAIPVFPLKGLFAVAIFCTIVCGTLYYLLQNQIRWLFFLPTAIVSLVLAGVVVWILPAFAVMQVEFFPLGDEDYLIVEIELPHGTTLDRTEIEARKVEEILYTQDAIESYVMTVGESSAYTGTFAVSSGHKFANAFIQLKSDRVLTSGELAELLISELSEIQTSEIRVTQLASGPPVGTPVVITFKGDNREQLDQLALEASRILKTIEGTNAVTTSSRDDSIEFAFSINREHAALLGIEPSAVANTIRTAVHGTEAITINTDTDDVDVVVKLALNPEYLSPDDTNNTTVNSIGQISMQTPNGLVLLSSVIQPTVKQGSAGINHQDGDRIATVESQLAENGNVAEILAEFRTRADQELNIPSDIEMILGGETEETTQSFAEMGYAVIAGLILMFSIIVLMFNSFRHAIYVIAPAFLSFIGIALGLTITGNALSFPALMGLIALIGIVVNNSIILIDVMNSLRTENPDMNINEIVVQGSASRLRPILLTTSTTVIGIIPLLFASSLWAPLAIAIIFGLSFSAIITLVMIPILYYRNPGTVN